MKKHLNILKLLMFNGFVLSSFLSFSMEVDNQKILKGLINLSDETIYLLFGSFAHPKLIKNVKPGQAELFDFVVPPMAPDTSRLRDQVGNYMNFIIGSNGQYTPDSHNISGQNKEFIIIFGSIQGALGMIHEIPVVKE